MQHKVSKNVDSCNILKGNIIEILFNLKTKKKSKKCKKVLYQNFVRAKKMDNKKIKENGPYTTLP